MNKQVRPPKIDDTQKKSVDELLRGFSSGISYRALEPRIAFDAAAVATAAATSDSTQNQTADAGSKQSGDAAPHAVSDGGEAHDANADGAQTHDAQHDASSDAFADAIMATDAPPQDAPVTIVFIDKAVENVDQIISSTDPNWEIVMIDQSSGGLDQMASYLSGRTDVGSIHVVSHGEAGTLYLGTDALTNANLADFQSQLTAIGQALNDNGDILLYGCEIGAGTGGMDFVRAFSNYTGADIAASIDKTGGDEAGGDWVLEATSGSIEAKSLENPLYAGILAKTNTGAWAANGATAANDWTNTTDGVTTTVTFTNGGAGTWTGTASDNLNTTAGGISATTFDNNAAGGASIMSTFTTDNTNDIGTITVTFSTAVTNPVIHIDRLGGVSGQANSAVLTLTSGGTLTRVSGVNHFQVDSGAGTITRQVGVNTSGSESNTNSANGTAAGSVRVNGTYTTITFSVRMNTAANAGIGDAFELAFAIDAPPTAVNDTFTTLHDTPATINVRANDTDPRGDTLTVTKVNGTAITAGGAGVAVTGGTVTLVSGNLVFTPTANYVGSPSFTYTVADANGGESTATVTGTVTNTAPTADLDGSAAGTGFSTTFTENGSAVSIADTDAVMTDVDDANLESATITLTNQQTGDRLLVNGSTASSGTIGTISWARTDTAVTFTGTATKAQYAAAIQQIQFENTTDAPATTARIINTIVNDGNANSNTAVTTIAIDRAPDPTDDAFSGNEDTAISANVLTNDTDVGDGPGSPPLSIVTGPTNGVLTSFNTTTGAFVYTPNANYNGTDTFVYRYTDADGDSKVATVTLTIVPVNDAPVNTVPASIGPVAEDGTLSITGVSVADVDGGALTTTVTIGNGVLNAGTGGGVTITGNGTGTVTLAGTAAQINAALATLSYTPTADYNGTATFQITTSDGSLSDVDSRTITVSAVADITNDTVTTAEDTPVTFSPLTNDSFENAGRTITAINGTAITAGGAGVAVTGGTVTLAVSGTLTFTPDLNYNGTPSFTYTVTSGGVTETATVNVTVTPVNDAPVAANDTGTIAEDTTLAVPAASGLLANDTDVDGNTLSVTQFAVSGVAGTFTAGNTATIPGVGTLTINANGSYTFVPAANYNGAVPVATYTVSDGAGGTATATLSIAVTPVNDAPVGVNDTGTIAEDTTLTVPAASGLLANDTDVDGNTLSVTQFTVSGVAGTFTAGTTATIPSVGTLTINANGSYTFVPAANYNGSVPVATYTVSDGAGGTATATLSIAVTPVNDAPVATNDTGTVAEDTTLTVPAASGLLANDTDVDGNTLSVTQYTVTGVAGTFTAGSPAAIPGVGTLTINANGSYTFVPAANYNGAVPVATYTVSDGAGGTATATLSIAVTPVNDAPVAGNDTGTIAEDTTLTVPAASGLLANDTDVDGNTLSVTQFTVSGVAGTFTAGTTATIPSVGTLTINANGSYTFVPAANYNGSVPVATYTVSDGAGGTATATLSIAVTPVNDAPVNTVPGPRTAAEDTAAAIAGVSVADVDGGSLTTTVSVTNGTLTVTLGGGATISGNGTGTITLTGTAATINAALAGLSFTGAADYNGPATLTVQTTDGALTDTDTVAITVTPVADITNDTISGTEDTASTFNVLTGTNGATADNFEATPSVTSVTQPANGSVTFAANGSITYTPSANFNGTDTFTYTVTSGGVTETATVTVNVAAVNDAPVNTVPGAQSSAEDTNLIFSAANGNAITVADVDSSVTTTLTVVNGTLTLGSIAGVTVTGNGSGTVTVSGTPAAITTALSGLRFAPTADWNGSTTLNVSTSDGVAPAVANTIAITVTPVADIAPNSVTTAEDTAATFNVLTNDSFENPGATVTSVTQPANGSVTIGAGGNVTYTPSANYNGTDTFTYTVTSGGVTETTTVTVTVTPVNDAPVADDETNSTPEDTTLTVPAASGVLVGDSDLDGDTLSVSQFTVAGVAGTFTAGATATIPSVGTLRINADGSYVFTPAANYNGAVPVATYTVSDGNGGTDTGTLTLTVTPVNDAPIAADDTGTATEDTTLTVPAASGLLANDTDVDGNTLTITQFTVTGVAGTFTAGSPASISGVGTLTINANGSYTFVPAANYNGAVPVATYTVSDGNGGTDTGTLTIAVTPVNDAPVADDEVNSTPEDTTLTVPAASGVLVGDTDVDGNTLSVSQFTVAGVAGTFTAGSTATISGVGTLRINADGSYVFTPAANYNGAVPVATYTVSDGNGGTDTGTLTLTVTPVNDAPIAVDDTGTATEDTTLTVPAASGLLANDTDVDGNTLTITQFTVTGVAGTFTAGSPASISGVGTLTINANGSYTFVPAANYNGAVPVATYTVSDGNGGTDTGTLTIAVTPVNDAPVNTVPGPRTAAEDTATAITGVSVSDVDGGSLTTTLTVTNGRLNVTLGGGATITGNGTGTVTMSGTAAQVNAALAGLSFTGNADYNGPATLTVQTSDGALTHTETVAITVTPVADITNDTVSGSEDATISFNVLTGTNGATADTFEGTPSVTAFTQPANGSVTVAANGAVVYTPNANFNGTDTFTYTVTSGGVTETATVTVNVAPVNDAPTQTLPPAQSGTEDTNVVFSGANGNQIILGDIDSGAVLTTTVSVSAGQLTAIATAGVTITGNGTGSVVLTGAPAAVTAALNGLTYRPVADANGTVVMSVSTSDGVAPAVNGSVSIAIAPVADIQNDTATGNEDSSTTISVLTNDTFENAGRTVTSVTNGANGTVVINGNGTVTYTPNANFNGTDTFTYTVTSGGVTETATVTVTVNPVNDAATQTTPPSQTTAEDTALVFSAANGNAVTVADIDGDTLTTTVSVTNGRVNLGSVAGVTVSGNGTGTVTLSGSASAINAALNGMAYTPTADYNGASAMTITTSDGATTASNTVAVTVSPVADIVADTVTTPEDQAVVFNVLTNDNFENAGRTVTSVTNGANGTVTIGSGGQVTYTPNANFNGTDSFTYTVTSGGVTETATVTVTVTPVNDAVVTTVPGSQTTNEDTTVVFSSANGNAITVTDIDGDNISMTVSATNGRLTLGGTAGVTVSGNGTGTVTLSGSPTAINAALNGLGFAPTADYNGSAVISVTASDGPTNSSRTIGVTIAPVADVVADSISTNEDTPITFNALTNDTFENAGRTVTSVTQGSSGSVTFAANGTMTYTPNLDYIGTDTFTYTVTSNGTTETTTVTVSIGGVNDVPTTTGLPDRAGQDAGVVSINVSGAFADEDGDALTYTATGLPAGLTINPTTGVISGTIDKGASQMSPYSVTVTANDGNPGGTVSTAFTWTISNPAPTANNDTATVAEDSAPTNINVLANDTDPDGDTLSVTTATASNGTVTILPNGTINYRPNANFNGTDTISYQISDGNGGFSTATVTVTVTPVNDAPVADNETNSTPEDTTLTVPAASGVLVGDTDIDGNTLSVSQFTVAGVTGTFTAGSTATIPSVGTLRINADGSYVFTPAANYNGAVPVATYTVSDGAGGTDTGTLTLTVTPVNDAPVANNDTRTATEDTTLTVPVATGLLANDTDVDGNTLTITQFTVSGVAGTFTAGSTATISGVGTLTINANGSYVFTPAANYNGAVPVATYTVSDGAGGTDTATLTIAVTPVNDAPVADNETNSTPEDTTLTVPAASGVLVGDTDVDGNTLSVSQFTVSGVTGTFTAGSTATISGVGTLRINADGSYVFTPAANYNGAVPVATYTVSDGAGGTDTGTLTLTVTPVNDAPVANNDTRTATEDTTLTVPAATGLLANDTDVDGNTLTITQFTVSGVAGTFTAGSTATISGVGTLRINADGSYVFTPAANYNGAVPVATYTVSDGAGGTDTATLTIAVTPVNDAPVADNETNSTPEDTTLTVPAASGVLIGDTDVDGNTLSVSQFTVAGVSGSFTAGSTATISGVGTLRINADGSYVFTPAANYNGAVPVATYTVSDGAGGTDTGTLTLTVTPVNDAPVVNSPIADRSNADGQTVSVNVSSNFSDVDTGDTRTYTATGLPAGLSINPATGAITGTINRAASQGGTGGAYSVTITATDGAGATVSDTFVWTITNPAPTAVADTRSTAEGATLTVTVASGVLANDTDPDGDPLTVSAINGVPANVGQPVAGSAGGLFTVNANGSYTFQPNGQFEDLGVGETRQTTVNYTVSDGNGGTSVATVTITVTGTNDAPTATAIPPASGVDGAAFTLNPSTSFSDVDGDTLTYSATGLPAGLSINPATGVISGTINRAASQGGAGGVYTVTITANDGNGGSTPATLTLTVTNPVPNAVNDSRSVAEDTVATGNVLTNDVDPDGDTLSVTGFSVSGIAGTFSPGSTANIPGVGTLTINANGAYTFTPAPNYVGAVPQVTYAITDGNGGTDTATLNLGPVTAGNDAPVSTALPGRSAADSSTVSVNVSGNFSDGDGDTLTFSATGLPPGLSINPTTGVISGTIDHLASANGPYSVTVRATDPSGASTQQTFSWAVSNPAPTGSPIANATGVDGTAVTMPVAGGFSDPDGDTLTFGASGLPAGLSINPATGIISGTLGRGASAGGPSSNGVYAIAVTATDSQGALVTRTFTYTVSNPAPTAGNDTFSAAEDTPLTRSVTGNDSDPDGDALSYSVVSGPANGTLVFNANGTFTYTPAANYNGADTFTYRVTDANGASATAVVTLNVTPVNDAPVASNVSVTTPEDSTFNGTLTATDVDSPSLTFTKATNPSHGTVVVNPNGTYVYTPAANYNGPDSFTYTVSDGAGGTVTRTVAINVTPVNDAPLADNETGTTPEDTPLNVPAASGLLVGDTDLDGDTLAVTQFTVSGVSGTFTAGSTATISGVGSLRINSDGSYVFTPAANYNGGVPVATYTVSDGNGGTDTGTLTLTVTPVNDAPFASNVSVTTPEDSTFNGTLTATDVDSPSLTFTKATNPSHGTVVVNPNGTYVYTPAANYNGPDSFTYTVSDGAGGTVTRTVAITVTPVNDAPLAVNDAFSGDEDTVITGDVTPGMSGQDSDIDGDAITVVDADGNASNGISPVSGPANGTLVLNADGTFSYRPNANFNGTDSFRYRISDGNGGYSEATVSLTVNPVNDAPRATNGNATTPEDTTYNGTLPPASDADGDSVTYTKASDPSNGTVIVNPDGTYVYTPSANYNGTDTFNYSINDGKGGVATYTVTVVVTPVDDPTSVLTITAPPSKDADVINFDVSKFVTDIDGDTLHYTASGLPPGLTINPVTGVVTGTLPKDASQGGPYNVTLTVDDGHGGVVTTTFPWPVTNPAPIAVDDAASVDRGKDVTVKVLTNDRDPDGDALTVTRAQATNGTVDVLPDGSIRYVPKDGFVGQDRITYVISDGNGGTAIASVTITVRDDGYNEKPPKFGFNGPGEPDPMDAEPVTPTLSSPIAADGAVVDAVFDIGLLRSVAGQLGANGAVLAAANGLRSLDGVASISDSGIVVETVRVERAREILFNAGFDRSFQEYRIEGLPGFSLRNNVPGNLGGLSAREQVVIESLVRQDTLIVQLSNTIESGSKRIVDYRITQADGSPLPPWLDHAAKDLLIGRREAGFEQLDLKVEAIYSDQTVIVERVRIDAATGEIQPLKTADAGQPAPRLFGDQFNAPSQLTPDEIQGLGKAIAR